MKHNLPSISQIVTTILMGFLLMTAGCGHAPMEFAQNAAGPQVIVEPPVISTGIAKLVNDTKIVFKGKGFTPGDAVFINIEKTEITEPVGPLFIADATVEDDGTFSTKVEKIVKINELLRAELGLNDEMEKIIVVSRPPIPEGIYTVNAESMKADKTAQCQLIIEDASFGESFKDWLGGMLGKIEKQ
ncbi:MAG: hypothetical protein SWH68_13420 [Thermodesulfobacteriota bacterium]|nr:hypothetical protein [Thermodesulfobacteriota bacterium]